MDLFDQIWVTFWFYSSAGLRDALSRLTELTRKYFIMCIAYQFQHLLGENGCSKESLSTSSLLSPFQSCALPLFAPPSRFILLFTSEPPSTLGSRVFTPQSRLKRRSRGSSRCSTLRLAQRQGHLAAMFPFPRGGGVYVGRGPIGG